MFLPFDVFDSKLGTFPDIDNLKFDLDLGIQKYRKFDYV